MSLRERQEVQGVPPAATPEHRKDAARFIGTMESAWRCNGWTLLAMDQADAIERFKRYFGWHQVPTGTVIARV